MKQARYVPVLAAALSWFAASGFYSGVFAARNTTEVPRHPEAASVLLDVNPIQQSLTTSCGEAAIAMAYQYADKGSILDEESIVEYAMAEGLYTPDAAPFTSPAAMVAIGRHFAGTVETRNVFSRREGLAILEQELQAGQPVIIDVTTFLGDTRSGAHFVLVTGVSTDPQSGITTITFNNPLTGQQQAAAWDGSDGVWNSWQNNRDPGGTGWWMVLPVDQANSSL
jgi:uncharacterized protein YvpB